MGASVAREQQERRVSECVLRNRAREMPIASIVSEDHAYSTPVVSSKHVIVADDDPAILAMVERGLLGYRVSRARDGAEALAILSGNDRVDLLIADYLMPTITGDELVGRARLWRPNLGVLIMTGHGALIASADADWWRSVLHIDKPFELETLRCRVHEMIGPP